MLTTSEKKGIIQATDFTIGVKTKVLLGSSILIGTVSFIVGLVSGSALYAWQALLVNTLFFAGLAYGSLMFSVMFTITGARWGRPIKRLAEATSLFIPVCWILFAFLFLGMDYFFEWSDPEKVIPAKSWWLNTTFFISRNIVLLVVTGLVGMAYVLSSVKPDLMELEKTASKPLSRFPQWLVSKDGSLESEREKQAGRQAVLAPVFGLLYAFLTCVIAFDWIMSIDQEWYSTLFGFQYSIANLFGAAAFLVIVSSIVRKQTGLTEYFSPERHNDLSRLLFATSLFWTYFIFSQVLVIWYANLPEETPYLILRMRSHEWSDMFYFLAVALFLIPFIGLLAKSACRSHFFSSVIAIDVLIGLWFEKYFLAVPSIQENIVQTDPLPGPELTILDLTVTLGVAGMFLLSFLLFLSIFPMLPIADSVLAKQDQ